MTKHGKKHQKALVALGGALSFSIREGMSKVKELAHARFDESVSVNVILGINPEKADQAVRGSLVLPHSIGKAIRVIAFAKGEQVEAAEKAGADFVGAEDLIEKILGGWTEFDYAVATPDLMALVGKVARILGPQGLLPNKKNGTVALELAPVIKELKSGLVFFKNDKNGHVHFTFGKVSRTAEQLEANLTTFFKVLRNVKPAASKGIFIKKATVSSTMGPGIPVSIDGSFK